MRAIQLTFLLFIVCRIDITAVDANFITFKWT
jgi:hypothetical protein